MRERKMSEDSAAEAFLRDNPEFLNDWLSKHGTAEHLQRVARRLEENDSGSKSELSLPLPSFSQVARNSITSSIFKKYLKGDRNRKTSVRKDRNSLCQMSEEELFMELIRDIASELDVNVLCHKILQNVSILTNSDRGSLFLVRGSRESRYLVSKLFDVTNISTLEESIHTEENEIKVPFGKGIAGHVAQTKEIININNAYEDPRFNQEVDKRTGYKTHAILCMPIINYEGEVIGVAQIINKLTGNHEFSKIDEQVFGKYLTFCGIGITNAQLFEMSVNEFKRNQLLLHLARGIFSEQTNLENLVEKIMLDAQDLLKCERCSVYLLENSFENDAHKLAERFVDRLGLYYRAHHALPTQEPCTTTNSSASSTATSPSPNKEAQQQETVEEDMCPRVSHNTRVLYKKRGVGVRKQQHALLHRTRPDGETHAYLPSTSFGSNKNKYRHHPKNKVGNDKNVHMRNTTTRGANDKSKQKHDPSTKLGNDSGARIRHPRTRKQSDDYQRNEIRNDKSKSSRLPKSRSREENNSKHNVRLGNDSKHSSSKTKVGNKDRRRSFSRTKGEHDNNKHSISGTTHGTSGKRSSSKPPVGNKDSKSSPTRTRVKDDNNKHSSSGTRVGNKDRNHSITRTTQGTSSKPSSSKTPVGNKDNTHSHSRTTLGTSSKPSSSRTPVGNEDSTNSLSETTLGTSGRRSSARTPVGYKGSTNSLSRTTVEGDNSKPSLSKLAPGGDDSSIQNLSITRLNTIGSKPSLTKAKLWNEIIRYRLDFHWTRARHLRRKSSDMTFSKAFYLDAKDKEKIKMPGKQELSESRTAQIAQYVVMNGKSVNVSDLEIDGRFGEGPFVEADGFQTRSILCMPIFNSDTRIIGVTCLMNKENGTPFNENDEGIIEAFSIFTGLGIHNCQMYENACRLMAKQTVALEILSYHATAQKEETDKLAKSAIPSADELQLYSFNFNDMHLDEDGTLKAVIRMFQEANIISTFKVPYEVVCRWACSVKKNYRPVTYHNWRHAFNVCQTMFTMLYTGEMRPRFDILDVFALMVACLCHDLDHRGTNNAFQVTVASPLAMLYSTSVLEHHHFDHCIMILNSEGNNIFQGLSPEDYKRAIHTLEHAILSTDLAVYFKKRGDFQSLVEQGEREFDEDEKKDLLKGMMMTACDVAAITKPWEIQQAIAQLVAGEFFEQGDIEKTQLGKKPLPMMDRDKKDELPIMQVGFIDAICLPVYKLFYVMNEKLEPLYHGCESNRNNWQLLARQETPDGSPTDTDSPKKTESKESHQEKESEVVTDQTSVPEVNTNDVDHKNSSDSPRELNPVQQNGAVTTQTSQNMPETDVIKPPSVKSSDSKEAIRKDRSSSKHSESDHSLKHKVDDDSRTYHDVRKNGDTKSSKGQKSGLCVVS